MEFFLQFGWGMMDHCRSLIRGWAGGTAILSPRDSTDKQLRSLAGELRAFGGKVLLDPQFYLPHAYHKRLCAHDYWPSDYESIGFWSGRELNILLSKIVTLCNSIYCDKIILPGLYAESIDDDWLIRQRAMLDGAIQLGLDRSQLLATVALSSEAVRDIDQIHSLLESSRDWPVEGVYLICEHTEGAYLVEDANWLSNVLDIVAGFRLRNLQVIVGYCNHQMLIAASASATAIASGTWMNVRSFPPEKFNTQYEEEMKQRKTWYYCPQALSEFKIPMLDIAYRLGVLHELEPDSDLSNPYVETLFGTVQPSIVGLSEQSAFRHYLHTLRIQALQSRLASFQETIEFHKQQLNRAERLLTLLHSSEISGQGRDFYNAIAANRAALSVLDNLRGPMLRRTWSRL